MDKASAERSVSTNRDKEKRRAPDQLAVLLDVNERLVLAALHAEGVAEAAIKDLDTLVSASQRDPLTQTPNRALTVDRLAKAMAMANRHRTRVAVLFVDLDRFKPVNDTLGHAFGDEVLQLVARRLESVVRVSDTVGRYGGDEFIVILSEVLQAQDAGVVAANILSALAAPACVDGHDVHLSASIGIAVYPEHGDDVSTLLGRADAAMYRSKGRAPGQFEFYEARDSGELTEKSATNAALMPAAPRLRSDADIGDPRLRYLRETNEQLVLAALAAHDAEAGAGDTHRRHLGFLATVAHELRGPLAPIRTAAALLLHKAKDDPLLTQLQIIIARQAAHMARLIDDLLDEAFVNTGKFSVVRAPVEISGVLASAVEMCRPAIDAKRQRLRACLSSEPVTVEGDPARLAQIFSNLLDNASKFTAEEGEIALDMTHGDCVIVVSISDNGMGFAAEVLPKLFDMFRQGPHAIVQRRGLGIGLAVVRQLVELHGGTVVGKSAGLGCGSEFTVTLPTAARN